VAVAYGLFAFSHRSDAPGAVAKVPPQPAPEPRKDDVRAPGPPKTEPAQYASSETRVRRPRRAHQPRRRIFEVEDATPMGPTPWGAVGGVGGAFLAEERRYTPLDEEAEPQPQKKKTTFAAPTPAHPDTPKGDEESLRF